MIDTTAGIEIDSIRLPPDKLAGARNTATTLLTGAAISHHELVSAADFLSFTAKVVVRGRVVLHRTVGPPTPTSRNP